MLPRPYGSAVAENTTHKLRMKAIMQQFKIPTAPFVSVTGGEAPAVDTLTWPLIVKPVDRCGSKGARIVSDPQNLHSQLQHALTSSLSHHALIEIFSTDARCTWMPWSPQNAETLFSIRNERSRMH